MAGLLIIDWVICYAAIAKKGSADDAKKFIESPLSDSAECNEKIIWWMSFTLDAPRVFVGFFASVMAIPNMLQLAPTFSAAVEPTTQKYSYYAIQLILSGCNQRLSFA